MSKTWYKNRYFIVFAVLATWLAFFDQNNFVYQYRLGKQIKVLQDEKEFYEKEIVKLKEQKELLSTDEAMLERFARETYRMKKEDEVLFLLKEKP